MAQFLKDEQLQYFTIDAEILTRTWDTLIRQMLSMPEYVQGQQATPPTIEAMLVTTIRFDGKGYRVFSRDALLNYFNAAVHVERIVFELVSMRAIQSSKASGSYVDLRLDASDSAPCFLTSSSDNEDWMNSSFSAVRDILAPSKNRLGVVRHPIIEVVLQLFGVLISFVLSAWAATLMAPSLNVENAFVLSFVFALLIMSNLWGYMNTWLKSALVRSYPKIQFFRPQKNRLHWLMQAIIGGVIGALVLFLIGQAFKYVGEILGFLVNSR